MKRKNHLLSVLFFGLCFHFAQAQTYTIYPIPQKVTYGSGSVELTSQINFICESGVDEFTRKRAKEVFEKAGYTLVAATSVSQTLTNLFLGVNGSNAVAAQYAANNGLPLTVFNAANNKFDAHLLQVNGNHTHGDIVVLGDTNGSAFYAFATLEQMFEQANGNTLRTVTFEDYAYLQHRGIVEGFYGHPYSVESRLSLLEFCKRFKMNVFIYGPKSDPYHLGNWRDNYPTTVTDAQRNMGWMSQDDLRTLGTKAQDCHVQFVWAAHPGLENGLDFSTNAKIDVGVEQLMTKFHHLYDLGIRGFGVFIDDMEEWPTGAQQAYLADATQRRLIEEFPSQDADKKISKLFYIPRTYTYATWHEQYLTPFRNVHSDVIVGFTGDNVFCNINGTVINSMANCIGRNPMLWWNNPVNDDHDDYIYMRELTSRWTIETLAPTKLNSLILNPMQEGQASKVALFGGADYAWNPAKFNAQTNWLQSFSYIVQYGDAEAAAALETFARFSDATIEEEDMIALYNNFMNKYSDGNLPAETTELRERMNNLREACMLIESWKNSAEKDYRLMYDDLRPWNAKLKTMSTITLEALDVLELDDNISRPDSWEKYRRLRNMLAEMSTDSIYMMSVLEGVGTLSSERFCLVKASDNHFRPFVEFLVNTVGANLPGEWPAKDQPQIVTNAVGLTTPSLSTTVSSFTLSGLYGVRLSPNEYVGIYFGDIKSIDMASMSLPNNLTLETSSNGKQWSEAQLPINDLVTSYVRLRNSSNSDVAINFSTLLINLNSNEIIETPTATTDMPTYQSYNISNVVDGSTSTYFWSEEPQTTGRYILLTFPDEKPRYDITLTFMSNDVLMGSAAIEVSTDNSVWTRVANFSNSDIVGGKFVCNANGRQARYVRFVITDDVSTPNWLQVAEFSVKGALAFAQSIDNNGKTFNSLSDNDLTTNYHPLETGFLEHDFIENVEINAIEIYHNTVFDTRSPLPVISVFNGEEWIEKGNLEDFCTILDTRDESIVTKLKIAWSAPNLPNIHEILPVGEYRSTVESSHPMQSSLNQPFMFVQENKLIIKSEQNIQSVILYDMQGRVLKRYVANENIVTIALDEEMPSVFAVQIIHQNGTSFTQKVIK